MVKELLDKKGSVNLFTRPRRFGKTLKFLSQCLIEFKVAEKFNQLDKAADEALAQIEERGYSRELEDDGYATVYRYGIAFCGKDCLVKLAADLEKD